MKLFYLAGWPLCGQTSRKRKPLIFKAFSGGALPASNASVNTLAIFAGPEAPRKCLLGSHPKPGASGLVDTNFTTFASGHFVPKLTPFRCASSPHTARSAGPVRGPHEPKALAAEPTLSVLFLIFPSPGDVKQMVDIALDGNQLPHGLLRGPVLRGQGFFSLRQLPPLLF